jgi:uncharacterized membrane protein
MRLSDRHLDFAPWIVATLLVAAIVHLVSVLLMPQVAPRDALARLKEVVKTSRDGSAVAMLNNATPGSEIVPFEDPSMAEGVCVFDLANGLLRIRANVEGDDFLGISFHGVAGRIFHAMTDRSAIKGKIDIVVGNADQIDALESEDSDDAPAQEIRLTAPSRRGFVMIRSLARRPSDRDRAEQRVHAVQCETFTPSQE